MSRMTRLLERNEQFTRTYSSAALGLTAAQVVVVACSTTASTPRSSSASSSATLPSSATPGAA